MDIILCQRKTDTCFNPFFFTESDAFHGIPKGTFFTPEPVMGLLHAVQADTDVLILDLRNQLDIMLVNHCAVAG